MLPRYWRHGKEDADGKLKRGVKYTQAPRAQPNLGRPFYNFQGDAPPLWREKSKALNSKPKYVLPDWMPEVWTKASKAPFDNSRSAMVRDNYDVSDKLADWDKRLRTHIASFNQDIRGSVGNVIAMPPLSQQY